MRIETSNDEDLAINLWRNASLRTLPSRYIKPEQVKENLNPQYVRIAMVHDEQCFRAACKRIKKAMM